MLVLALFLMGVVYAGFAPAGKSNADTTMTQQVKEGQALFAVGCASCHGLQGEGGSQGPSLVGVGAAAVDFQVSTGRMPMAHPGEQAPRKPNSYTPEDTEKLAAYVASLGPGPAIPTDAQYNPSGLTEEQIADTFDDDEQTWTVERSTNKGKPVETPVAKAVFAGK